MQSSGIIISLYSDGFLNLKVVDQMMVYDFPCLYYSEFLSVGSCSLWWNVHCSTIKGEYQNGLFRSKIFKECSWFWDHMFCIYCFYVYWISFALSLCEIHFPTNSIQCVSLAPSDGLDSANSSPVWEENSYSKEVSPLKNFWEWVFVTIVQATLSLPSQSSKV